MKFSAGRCQDEPGLPAVAAIQRSKGGLFLFHKLSGQLLTHQKCQISGRNFAAKSEQMCPGHVIKFFQREEERTILHFAPMCHTVCRRFSEVRSDRKHWESPLYSRPRLDSKVLYRGGGDRPFVPGSPFNLPSQNLCEKKRCSSLLSLRPQTDGSDSFSSL